MPNVVEEPFKKETLGEISESSDPKNDEMNFDSPYETLHISLTKE